MYYVYIIKSQKNNKFYIGSTQNIEERIRQHNLGKTRSLRNKGPFDIIKVEECETKTEARKREAQIKRYKGGRAFKKLLVNTNGFGDVV